MHKLIYDAHTERAYQFLARTLSARTSSWRISSLRSKRRYNDFRSYLHLADNVSIPYNNNIFFRNIFPIKLNPHWIVLGVLRVCTIVRNYRNQYEKFRIFVIKKVYYNNINPGKNGPLGAPM